MHYWGDSWFEKHGDNLNKGIILCMSTWRTIGRIGTHGKEKYGTFRDHIYMWDGGIHSLLYPGYVRIVNKFLYFKVDKYIIKPITKYSGLHRLGLLYQSFIYNYAVQKACKLYPDIVDELVADLDGYRMVKPGLFGNINGQTIHDKHWRSS